MKPANPKKYRGIVFVQLTSLPDLQRQSFIEWLPEIDKIKVQTENQILTECVPYKEYMFWFNNFFNQNDSLENQI